MARNQAQEILPQDTILVNLVGADKKANRPLAITLHFDGEGNQVGADRYAPKLRIPRNEGQGRAPVFPVAAMRQVVNQNGREEQAETQRLIDQYQKEMTEYRRRGNKPLVDLLVDSVFEFIRAHVPEVEVDGQGQEWTIRKDQVLTRIPFRADDEGVVFTVQPTPVWGARS